MTQSRQISPRPRRPRHRAGAGNRDRDRSSWRPAECSRSARARSAPGRRSASRPSSRRPQASDHPAAFPSTTSEDCRRSRWRPSTRGCRTILTRFIPPFLFTLKVLARPNVSPRSLIIMNGRAHDVSVGLRPPPPRPGTAGRCCFALVSVCGSITGKQLQRVAMRTWARRQPSSLIASSSFHDQPSSPVEFTSGQPSLDGCRIENRLAVVAGHAGQRRRAAPAHDAHRIMRSAPNPKRPEQPRRHDLGVDLGVHAAELHLELPVLVAHAAGELRRLAVELLLHVRAGDRFVERGRPCHSAGPAFNAFAGTSVGHQFSRAIADAR